MMRSSSWYTVSSSTATDGHRSFNRGMASMPDMPGSPMSSSTTCGGSSASGPRASSAERKVPVQRKPGVPRISAASPSRISRWSSTIATRKGSTVTAFRTRA
jgi:hypothetical protein